MGLSSRFLLRRRWSGNRSHVQDQQRPPFATLARAPLSSNCRPLWANKPGQRRQRGYSSLVAAAPVARGLPGSGGL